MYFSVCLACEIFQNIPSVCVRVFISQNWNIHKGLAAIFLTVFLQIAWFSARGLSYSFLNPRECAECWSQLLFSKYDGFHYLSIS